MPVVESPAVFPPQATQPQVFCTESACPSGHTWVPRVQVAECPGCRAPVLAVEMRNCPVCNEPASAFRLRSEHISPAMGLSPVCQGVPSRGEGAVIEMARTFAKQTETVYVAPHVPAPTDR
jgi:hypothetical protein